MEAMNDRDGERERERESLGKSVLAVRHDDDDDDDGSNLIVVGWGIWNNISLIFTFAAKYLATNYFRRLGLHNPSN